MASKVCYGVIVLHDTVRKSHLTQISDVLDMALKNWPMPQQVNAIVNDANALSPIRDWADLWFNCKFTGTTTLKEASAPSSPLFSPRLKRESSNLSPRSPRTKQLDRLLDDSSHLVIYLDSKCDDWILALLRKHDVPHYLIIKQ